MAASEIAASFLKSVENAGEVQSKLLESLLRKNADCEYLRRHGLNGRTDLESFRSCIPVINYDAVAEDIERLMQDHTAHILCCEQTTEFFVSSGTSAGKRKTFPVTASQLEAIDRYLSYLEVFEQQADRESAVMASGPRMMLYSVARQASTPGGLKVETAISSLLKRRFGNVSTDLDLSKEITSPIEVILCDDYEQATYCHLVCGLIRFAQVSRISVPFASGLANIFGNFKQWWEEICSDIEQGKLSSRIKDAALHASVSKLLVNVDKDVARSIRRECSKESWEGIIPRIWPNVRLVTCATTGSMEQYVDHIEFLTGGQIQILSQIYAASEAYMGINTNFNVPPREVAYTLMADVAYFEFLDLDEEQSVQSVLQPIELAAVKEGRQYELVVTNFAGLWRSRIGDIVKCVGFYHSTPVVRIMGRKNVILSISTDKTEELELMHVLIAAAKQELPPDVQLVDYSSAASVASVPGHYIIFWELIQPDGQAVSIAQLEKCCKAIEAGLSEPYRRGRNIGTIAPLELHLVESGCFRKLAERIGATPGASTYQYKTPRCVKGGTPVLQFLEAAVVQVAWSRHNPPHPYLNPERTG